MNIIISSNSSTIITNYSLIILPIQVPTAAVKVMIVTKKMAITTIRVK